MRRETVSGGKRGEQGYESVGGEGENKEESWMCLCRDSLLLNVSVLFVSPFVGRDR